MTDLDQVILEREHLLKAHTASEANKVLLRLKVFDIGYRVFQRNFSEWENVIQNRVPADPMQLGQMREDRAWFDSFVIDATWALHNFVASVQTLIDTGRVLYDELYAPMNLIPEYPAEIDQRFQKDGLAQFVKGLRQYCQHYRLPLVSAKVSMNLTTTGGVMSVSVPVSLQQINLFRSWNATAAAFIRTFEGTQQIDLEVVLKEYRDKVTSFNEWFSSKQQVIHSAAITETIPARLHVGPVIDRSLYAQGTEFLLSSSFGFNTSSLFELREHLLRCQSPTDLGQKRNNFLLVFVQ